MGILNLFTRRRRPPVEFDEIFLDASNLPSFNTGRMEGKMELPLARRNVYAVAGIFFVILSVFGHQLFTLQVSEGAELRERSEQNTLNSAVIIAERGVIYDRNFELLAWNEMDHTGTHDFPVRAYTDRDGLGQLIGFVSYPKRDNKGFYFRTEYLGRSGVEEAYHKRLEGENGVQLIESDALGNVISGSSIELPIAGDQLVLSVDAELSEVMYDILATTTAQTGFRSGAAAIMDVTNGEIVAMASYPSYDPEVMADGNDVEAIAALNNDDRFPFLNKVTGGLYTPGSVVKPFVAYAALAEDVISPNKIITSTGEIVVPNPYNPSNPSRFTDWRVHGQMDMRKAIAFSSNVYFYTIGGGFGDQAGLGILKINEYMNKFGFGTTSGIALIGEQEGTVPNPDWKQEVFDEDWRLGDTYFTSIGQYGFQSTPLQLLRAYAALGNGGKLFEPHVIKDSPGSYTDLELDQDKLQVIQEGMRMTVNFPGGTARGLERSDVAIAGKSGTAELGASKAMVNTWIAGFYPYEEPRYSFVLMMERGPRTNTVGASWVMKDVLDWMTDNRPEMLGLEVEDEESV